MSKFFIGQRVKKARGEFNIGREAIVVALGCFTHDSDGIKLNAVADMAVRGSTPWQNTAGRSLAANETTYTLQAYYEPVVPDGMQPAEWKDCFWQPEHLKSTA